MTWNAPGEGSCWQIDAAHPDLGLVVSAEDPSGVNAVQLYLGAVTSTTPVAADSSSPYQLSVPPALLHVDSLRIIVQAIDRSGRLSQAEVTVRPNRICLVRGTR